MTVPGAVSNYPRYKSREPAFTVDFASEELKRIVTGTADFVEE
jgi:hypothetical protein